jgi:hypothetical protein
MLALYLVYESLKLSKLESCSYQSRRIRGTDSIRHESGYYRIIEKLVVELSRLPTSLLSSFHPSLRDEPSSEAPILAWPWLLN